MLNARCYHYSMTVDQNKICFLIIYQPLFIFMQHAISKTTNTGYVPIAMHSRCRLSRIEPHCRVNCFECLTHFIPSPQPTRATVLPGCLPILASQNWVKTDHCFHLPLLCDFLSRSPKLPATTIILYIYQRKANKINFTVVSIL